MTLSEIENTLAELVSRHPNLDIGLLQTLLLSAGWEDKNIQEALVLFRKKGTGGLSRTQEVHEEGLQKAIQTPPPQIVSEKLQEEITFYQPDGREEGQLHSFADLPTTKENNVEQNVKKAEPLQETPPPLLGVDTKGGTEGSLPQKIDLDLSLDEKKHDIQEEQVRVFVDEEAKEKPLETRFENVDLINVTTLEEIAAQSKEEKDMGEVRLEEPQSLIKHEEFLPKTSSQKVVAIPEDLPLLPFESSPHNWSFSHYKDVFHGGGVENSNHTDNPEIIKKEIVSIRPTSVQVMSKVFKEPIEVDLERVPMDKKDESLVFLAGTMLLVIILILGYMYSNGRL